MKHKFNIADIITVSRILFAILILFSPTYSIQFYIFYFIGAFSDMVDGTIARYFRQVSSFGAKLDTLADFIFIMIVFIKIILSIVLPKWLWVWIAIIALIKLTNFFSGYVIYRKFITEHTMLNKITGCLLFILPISIGYFQRGIVTVEVISICIIATFAAIQEGHYIRTGKEIK